MVKRDTITDIKDSVGNILGVNKEESLLDYIEDEIDTQLDVDVSTIHCNEFSLLIAHSNTKSELPAHSTHSGLLIPPTYATDTELFPLV